MDAAFLDGIDLIRRNRLAGIGDLYVCPWGLHGQGDLNSSRRAYQGLGASEKGLDQFFELLPPAPDQAGFVWNPNVQFDSSPQIQFRNLLPEARVDLEQVLFPDRRFVLVDRLDQLPEEFGRPPGIALEHGKRVLPPAWIGLLLTEQFDTEEKRVDDPLEIMDFALHAPS